MLKQRPQARHFLGAAAVFILELLKIGVLAGITIFLVRYFLFKPFYVKGASMEPNFYEKEYLIIDEVTFRLRQPERGEVVVFVAPTNPQEYFLKRIIGLPGERVKVSEGHVFIYNKEHPEGAEVEETYLPHDLLTSSEQNVILPSDQYFVLGDNRPNSFDSRRFGLIDRKAIVGRAWLRGWPPKRMQTFSPPQFNF